MRAAVKVSDEAHDRLEPDARRVPRRRAVLIAAGILGLNVVGVAVLFSPYGLYDGFDPYDDSIRGTNPAGSVGVRFGQVIGPDGDGCWPDNSRDYSGTVYCDLLSIGGAALGHWRRGGRCGESVLD